MKIYDLKSAAEYLAIGEDQVNRAICEGRLQAANLDGNLRITELDLHRYLRESGSSGIWTRRTGRFLSVAMLFLTLAVGAAVSATTFDFGVVNSVPDAIPYEGYLEVAGSPANGEHTLRLTLYADDEALTAQEFTLVVSNGRFSTALKNLKQEWFDRGALEIGIEYCNTSGCPNPVSLTGRQSLNSVPFAVKASKAEGADEFVVKGGDTSFGQGEGAPLLVKEEGRFEMAIDGNQVLARGSDGNPTTLYLNRDAGGGDAGGNVHIGAEGTETIASGTFKVNGSTTLIGPLGVTYITPGVTSDSYEFLRFGTVADHWLGIMRNGTAPGYGPSGGAVMFTYGNRPLTLKSPDVRFQGKTTVTSHEDVQIGSASGAFRIGAADGAHMAVDNNEIMAKSGVAAAATLHLNKEGGNIVLGNSTSKVIVAGQITAPGACEDVLCVDAPSGGSGSWCTCPNERPYLKAFKYADEGGDGTNTDRTIALRCCGYPEQ